MNLPPPPSAPVDDPPTPEQEQVRESEARSGTVMRASLDCILIADQHGIVQEFNRRRVPERAAPLEQPEPDRPL